VAERTGIKKLALAHTADDQVETIPAAVVARRRRARFGGIWPERQLGNVRVIRPLLKVRRAEILEY